MIFADIYDCDPDFLNPKPATRIEVWYWGFSHTWGQEDCHGLSNATISDPKTKVTWRDNEITGISACFHANLCRFSVQETPSYLGLFLHLISWLLQLLSLAVSTGPKPFVFSLVTFFSDFGHLWHLWNPRNCFLNYTKYTRSTELTHEMGRNLANFRLLNCEPSFIGSLGRIPMSNLSQWIWQSVAFGSLICDDLGVCRSCAAFDVPRGLASRFRREFSRRTPQRYVSKSCRRWTKRWKKHKDMLMSSCDPKTENRWK